MNARVVPTAVHGAVDYVLAPALVAAPDLLRLDGSRSSALAPRIAGAGAAVYSALTDYELGLRRVIPMRVHLLLDAGTGVAVAAAPWLLGSARNGVRHWLPHAAVGAAELALAATTKLRPAQTRRERALAAARRAAPNALSSRPAAIGVALAGAAVIGAVAYAGRRHLWRGVALAADAVEEVADAIEDAADAVEDAAEDVADAARARAGDARDDD